MRKIDVFMYNGELDILRLHLSTVNDWVSRFIIVEAPTTFSGRPKPLYFQKHKQHLKMYLKKIDYHVIDENYTQDEINIAFSSPNTMGAFHWNHEFLQKESIKKALTNLQDDDIVFIGDVDEMWDYHNIPYIPQKLKLRVYAYYLDNRSDEQFWGTLVAKYKDIKGACLNHLRTNAEKTQNYHGWHFTSMGGIDEIRRKLNDSYTVETYNSPEIQRNLEQRLKNGMDYIGRDFHFWRDTSEWPIKLKRNRTNYRHLLMPYDSEPNGTP